MRNKLLAFMIALLGLSVVGIVHLSAQAAGIDRSRDCDKYAIVYCGTMSAAEVRDKYYDKDHDKVFKSFGISKADVSGDIRKGVVYRDGTVKVGGKTVATGAVMAARHLGGSSISGSSTAKKLSVSHMSSAQEALVKFDANGEFEWAIMTPCGNPVVAKPVKVKKPVYRCDSLSAVKLSRDEFEFTTDATARDGASISGYSYNFGDGTSRKAGKSTTHAYTKPGTYTVTAKVSVKVHDKTVTAPGTCVAKVTVVPENCPIPGKEQYPKDSDKCVEDKPGVAITKYVDGVKLKEVTVGKTFVYDVVVKNTGDVALKDVVVTDPAPAGVTLVSADRGTITANEWTYTIDSLAVGESQSFAITAKLPKYKAGDIVNQACVETPTVPGGNPDDCDTATITTKIKVCDLETNQIVTINSKDLDEDRYSTDLSDCEETPPELPETGPVDTILSVVGLGSLAGAGLAYYASRRSLG